VRPKQESYSVHHRLPGQKSAADRLDSLLVEPCRPVNQNFGVSERALDQTGNEILPFCAENVLKCAQPQFEGMQMLEAQILDVQVVVDGLPTVEPDLEILKKVLQALVRIGFVVRI
jgi:hypothetical protein